MGSTLTWWGGCVYVRADKIIPTVGWCGSPVLPARGIARCGLSCVGWRVPGPIGIEAGVFARRCGANFRCHKGCLFKPGSPVGDEVPRPRWQRSAPFANPVGGLPVTPDAILINSYQFMDIKNSLCPPRVVSDQSLEASLLLVTSPLTPLPAQWTWSRLLCPFLRPLLLYHLLLPLLSLVLLSPPQLLMLLHPMPHLPHLSLLLPPSRLPQGSFLIVPHPSLPLPRPLFAPM